LGDGPDYLANNRRPGAKDPSLTQIGHDWSRKKNSVEKNAVKDRIQPPAVIEAA
jgi:hypothetical protein